MRIGVAGAGISGMTFAVAMQRLAPTVQVELYERDPSASSRTQGYSLGVKGDAGIPVLKTLGLYERLAADAITISNFVFLDHNGKTLMELPTTGDEKRLTQRVRRDALRRALLSGIGGTPISYGRRVTAYSQTSQSAEVEFENGTRATVDYLVAGEGVSSPIRQQMFGDPKRYLGLTAIVGDAPVLIQHPLLDGGYFMTLGNDGSSVFCYRQADGVHLSYTVHAVEGALDAEPTTNLLKRLQDATRDWHAPIPQVAASIDSATLVARGYYDKEPLKRVHDGRVWLIGDAAHPMCPFQGEGANMAMVDALKLAEYFATLSATADSTGAAAKAVDQEIVTRNKKAVLESRNAAKQFHERGGLRQSFRNVGFRMANTFIRVGTRKE